jgi:hypothetical protein
MKRKPAWLKKWKLAPPGLVATKAIRKRTSAVQGPCILVPYARMQRGLWGLKEGDIHSAYTADQRPKIRKPFEYGGQLWANWGGSESSVCCTPLIPIALAHDLVLSERQQFSYEGERVTWRGQEYICGPEFNFRAELGPGAISDLARRMFAYGGMFASRVGSYRNLLRKWLTDDQRQLSTVERIIYQAELEADLPQTQEEMRLLLGGARATEPPRFDPLTGKAV